MNQHCPAVASAATADTAAAAEAEAHPSRTPSPGEWLFGETDTMVYHEVPAEDDAS